MNRCEAGGPPAINPFHIAYACGVLAISISPFLWLPSFVSLMAIAVVASTTSGVNFYAVILVEWLILLVLSTGFALVAHRRKRRRRR